jgi:hypothetical protein
VVFGLPTQEFVRRLVFAMFWAILTFILAYFLPVFLFRTLNLPIEEAQFVILPGAIALTALGIVREIFRNHPIGLSAGVALVIGSALYLLRITNSGYMVVNAMGLKVTFEFPLIVYIFLTSSMLTAISVIWSAMHSVGADPMEKMEEEIKV